MQIKIEQIILNKIERFAYNKDIVNLIYLNLYILHEN